jgi:hypothetical protein
MMQIAPMAAWRYRVALACLAILLPWTALLLGQQPINHDVAWFFYVARGVMHGGVLYRDFIEPNAPLASLSLMPAVWLSGVLGITPARAVEINTLTIMAIVLLLCVEILHHMGTRLPHLLFGLLTLAIAFLLLPKSTFGQREHILAMLLTPYVLGCAAACAGVRLPSALGCAIGLAATIAVGLKPPFILVPAALEMVTVAQAGWQGAWRAQPIALAIGMSLVTGATLLLFPLYVTTVVPWATALYGGYNQPGAVRSFLERAFIVTAILWCSWNPDRDTTARASRACITTAAVAALAVFALQGKGWMYQAFPAWAFLLLLTAGAIATTGLVPGGSLTSWLRWGSARLLAVWVVIFIVRVPSHIDMVRFAGLAQAISAQPGPFVILSTNVLPGFPLALEKDRTWASRFPCLIMLPGLVKAEQRGQVSRWEAPFRQWIDADMRRYKPVLVFVPPDGDQALPPAFNVLAWLLRDPEFASIWAHYRPDGTRDGFQMFRLS